MEVKIGVQNANRELVLDSRRVQRRRREGGRRGARRRAAGAHARRQQGPQGAGPADKLAYVEIGSADRRPGRLPLLTGPAASSGREAEGLHALRVVLGEPGEQPADRRQVHARAGPPRRPAAPSARPARRPPAAPGTAPPPSAGGPTARAGRRPAGRRRSPRGPGRRRTPTAPRRERLSTMIVRVSASRNAAISR